MDGLSRLVRMARLEGEVDVRCLIAGRFTLENGAAGPGRVPFHLVLEGHCTLTAGATSTEMGPGDMALLPHGDAHQVTAKAGPWCPVADEPGTAFTTRRTIGGKPDLDLFCGHYHFRHPGTGSLLFTLMPPLVQVPLDAGALALADILRDETRFDGPGTGAIVAALFDALLTMALRSRPERRLDTPALWTAMGDDLLGRAIAGIVDRPGEAWTIDRLAAAARMSRATFVRRFAARTGTTPASLLTAVRMMIAADLLASTEHSVTRIAKDVGYRSPSAFGRAFHEALGTTPNSYRKAAGLRRQGG
ncbi:cupin domain-containing protein [Pseudonocardia spinosispora]|uniref:cupin domain-containing protein n=1 Tax=Pseudonocardia spinosispora TaxID=103441 RepID=UPI00041593CF|nr:AraC family transcriptional regulator [Pseudonocardia spinosispora]